MDLSRFQNYYKSRTLKFGAGTLTQRKEDAVSHRRSSRNNLMMLKRNIPRVPLTPIDSPVINRKSTKRQSKGTIEGNNRLEMLRKWQLDKKRRVAEEDKKRKPIFKVQHVTTSNSYDLKKIYSQIKGKQIDFPKNKSTMMMQDTCRLAPSSTYKFKPPANIRPLNVKILPMDKIKADLTGCSRVTRSQTQNANKTRKALNFQIAKEKTPKKSVARSNMVKDNKQYKMALNEPKKGKNGIVAIPWNTEGMSPIIKDKQNKMKKRLEKANDLLENIHDVKVRHVRLTRQNKMHESPIPGKKAMEKQSSKIATKNAKEKRRSRSMTNSIPISSITPDDKNLKFQTSSDKIVSSGKFRDRKKRQLRSKLEEKVCNEIVVANDYAKKKRQSVPRNTSASSDFKISTSSQPLTPIVKQSALDVVYVSPFVTISRGKENARREYHRRSENWIQDGHDSSTSPKAAAAYFYKLLDNEKCHLQTLCFNWNEYIMDESKPEEVCDMINVAVGQTNLLLRKKFEHFRKLIDSCVNGNSEKPVTCLDLHGFWDLVMIQVENVKKRFDNLDKLKANDWEEILPQAKPVTAKPRPKRKIKKASSTGTSSLKALIEAARKKKVEQVNADTILLSLSPILSRSTRKSIRASAANSKVNSPATSKIGVHGSFSSQSNTPIGTQAQKTPKSILKLAISKSIDAKSKAVLFKEQIDDTIAVPDMITFTPNKPRTRRSSRIEK